MTTPSDGAVATITRTLAQRAPVYSGLKPASVQALGAALASGGSGAPEVLAELGHLAAIMALDPDGFYEAAALGLQRFRVQVQRALAELRRTLLEGPNALILWSPSSRGNRPGLDTSDTSALLSAVRKIRMSRSEVTEEVHADLLREGYIALESLARVRRSPELNMARPATAEALDRLMARLVDVEVAVQELMSLQARWQAVPWREFALRRLLEVLDADLQTDLNVLNTAEATAQDVDVSMAHHALGVEVLERLLTAPSPFGEILAPDVRLISKPDLKSLPVRLRPVPPTIKGTRSWPARVDFVTATSHRILTCVQEDGAWNHPTWFEQGLSVTASPVDVGWARVATCTALDDLLLSAADGRLLQDAAGVAPPALIIQHGVFDASADYSYDYANGVYPGYNCLFSLIGDLPDTPVYVRVADPDAGDEGYLVELEQIAASPTTLAGRSFYAGRIADPLGNLPSTVATYLLSAAIVDDPPREVNILGAYRLAELLYPLNTLDADPGTEPIRLAVEVQEPYDAWHGGDFDGVELITVSALGSAGAFWATFSAPWALAHPYGVDRRFAAMVLYRDVSVHGTTRTLRLSTGLSAELQASVLRHFRISRLRLVDTSEVYDTRIIDGAQLYIASSDAPISGLDVEQEGDLILKLSEGLPVAGTWALDIQLGVAPGVGQVTSIECSAADPWRGWSELPVDLAPGDRLYASDGQVSLVWGTSGNQARIVPGFTMGPGDALSVLRVRHIQEGDRVVVLSDLEDETSVWRLDAIDATGLYGRPLSGVALTYKAGTQYARPAVATVNTPLTPRFEVIGAEDTSLVDLDDVAHRLRAQLEAEVTLREGAVSPVEAYLRVGGKLQRVEVVGPSRVRLPSLPRPLPSGPLNAELVVKARTDGYDGTFELREVAVSDDGENTPVGALPLGNARVFDLLSLRENAVLSGTLPATAQSFDVRVQYALRGTLRGPCAGGGSRPYPPWGLTVYRLERRSVPDFQELRDDVGRARATLGGDARALTGLTGLTAELAPDRITLTLTLPSPSWTASQLEGLDVVFSQGAALDPPLRIREASVDGVTASIVLSRTAPSDQAGTASLRLHALASGWREARAMQTYLESLLAWSSYALPVQGNRVADAAARLKVSGFDRMAEALQQLQFERWVDPQWGSQDNRSLADVAEALLDDLERRRARPIDGGSP